MAQNQQPQKSKWGVGSFLQQAVAGVESRLDLMLADSEDLPPKAAATKSKSNENVSQMAGSTVTKPRTPSISRNTSNARKNDRLQERLARAMVKSNAAGSVGSRSSPASSPARTSSPAPSSDARTSLDAESINRRSTENARNAPEIMSTSDITSSVTTALPRKSNESDKSMRNSNELDPIPAHDANPKIVLSDTSDDAAEADQVQLSRSAADESEAEIPKPSTAVEPAESVASSDAEHRAAEARWQEEMHGYIERIDALQSKLKYLAKEAAESAKQAAAAAEPGSLERKLREKDEKIALLLEEGQKLSKSELDQRTALKKLRQQLADSVKAQNEARSKTEKLERDLANAEARARRAEAAEKRAADSLSSQTKLSRDLESVTAERNALNQTVQDMKSQLARANERATAAEVKAQSEALELEKRRTAQLEEELTSAKIEREIAEEKSRREIQHLKEKIEQEKERARILELELKGEQSVLESKMESLRSRAEEASTGAAGDAQAKLLRQIETLQTQYAVASENWQTLEGSLLARLSSVERERDEIARRESDLRRKLREMTLKAKRAEEELETVREAQNELEGNLERSKQQLQKTEQRLKKASEDLTAAQNDFREQKTAIEASWSQRLEEERAKLREQFVPPTNFLQEPRTESPVANSRRSSTRDAAGPGSEYRPTSRRSSTLPASPDLATPPRQNSNPTLSQAVLSPPTSHYAAQPTILETPSITFEPDEFYHNGTGTPVSPSTFGGAHSHQTRGINDIISESTVGAGPSVQLVERMSATVRRLESERAASKDELARVTAQRDEARQQVVDLMRELDEKKISDAHARELEQRLSELDQRYQTTLELLGEKTELVEELQADIADLKKIYRELVDSTMK